MPFALVFSHYQKRKKILEPPCLVDCIDISVCGSILLEIALKLNEKG